MSVYVYIYIYIYMYIQHAFGIQYDARVKADALIKTLARTPNRTRTRTHTMSFGCSLCFFVANCKFLFGHGKPNKNRVSQFRNVFGKCKIFENQDLHFLCICLYFLCIFGNANLEKEVPF